MGTFASLVQGKDGSDTALRKRHGLTQSDSSHPSFFWGNKSFYVQPADRLKEDEFC